MLRSFLAGLNLMWYLHFIFVWDIISIEIFSIYDRTNNNSIEVDEPIINVSSTFENQNNLKTTINYIPSIPLHLTQTPPTFWYKSNFNHPNTRRTYENGRHTHDNVWDMQKSVSGAGIIKGWSAIKLSSAFVHTRAEEKRYVAKNRKRWARRRILRLASH